MRARSAFVSLALLTALGFSTPALSQDSRNQDAANQSNAATSADARASSPQTLPQAALPAPTAAELEQDRNRSRANSRGLDLNLQGLTLSGDDRRAFERFDFEVPRLDIPVDTVGSTLFRLDLPDMACLGSAADCAPRERVNLGVTKPISIRNDDDGIDLVLRPRANFRFDDDRSSALVGAVVEIGEDLRRGSEFPSKTWYLFAGADAEALTYSPDGLSRLNSGQFHLQDRIIVGDAQAGLGYRIGDADVSVSYLRREAQAEGISYNEDAAALSFTWKR